MIRVVHYINQFFGQIGGEDMAGIGPRIEYKPVGPGIALKEAFKGKAEIIATVICGDNYFMENMEKAVDEIIELIRPLNPDLLVAGPAFNAGRYGPACGALCKAVGDRLKISSVTGMYPENPGVELFHRDVYCVETGPSAAGMRKAVADMARLGMKLALGEELGPPFQEGYLPKGFRRNVRAEKSGAVRAVDMLLAKIDGRDFRTELPMPEFEKIPPAPALSDLRKSTIALVTEGGIVPKGNPDRLESSRATKYLKYSIEGLNDLSGEYFESVHGGYNNRFANLDPDRVLPLDVLREIEREGEIKEIHKFFFTTTGNGTTIENSRIFGKEIAGYLRRNGIDGVILTST